MDCDTNLVRIETKTKGMLDQYLTDNQLSTASEIKISGPMSDEDIVLLGKYIRSHSNIISIDLKAVTDLTSIDHNAFEKCKSLEHVVLPQSIKRIVDHAFDQCPNLKEQELPDTIEIVGDRSFSGCENLESINIPQNVSYIGIGAFYGCYKLTDVKVAQGNNRYENRGGVLFDNVDKTLVRYIQTKQLKQVFTTPKGVVHIGNYAFDGCKGLVSVIVSEGCTDLGERSFTKCNELKNISLPASIDNLNYNAFDDCDALEEIIVDHQNETYQSMRGVLYSKDMKTLKICPKSKKSPFFFPESIEVVDEGAFSGCKNIKSVVLPSNTKVIKAKAFYNCERLESINVPTSLECIGDFGFANCHNLKKIMVYSSNPPKCGVSPFAGVDQKNCQIIVPIDAEIEFRKDYGWDSFENIEESINLTIGSNFTFTRRVGLKLKRFILTHFNK